MTITKKELHKLIDELDMDKLISNSSEIENGFYESYETMLMLALKRCQLPTQQENMKKLFNKLKLMGFEFGGYDNQYTKEFSIINNNQNIKKYITVIVYKTYIEIIGEKENIIVENITNHDKVFEAIDFLTKWQA